MKPTAKRFMLIDDDMVSNLFCTMILKKTLGEIDLSVFTHPGLGLRYIETEFRFNPDDQKTILFLDINMPAMTGWEFLEKFQALTLPLKSQFSIYILSSSVDLLDIERSKSNPLVVDFIEKPLKKLTLSKMFGSQKPQI